MRRREKAKEIDKLESSLGSKHDLRLTIVVRQRKNGQSVSILAILQNVE